MPDPAERDILADVIHLGVLAADMEALGPQRFSSVRNPDGSAQPETHAEHTRRIIGAAIRHLVAAGLLAVPENAADLMEDGIPPGR
jgi:hypothetical protein